MVGSEPGVRQRCGLHRVESAGELHQVAGSRHQQVLRHPTIEAEAAATTGDRCQVGSVTVGLETGQTTRAGAAAPSSDDGDRFADVKITSHRRRVHGPSRRSRGRG